MDGIKDFLIYLPIHIAGIGCYEVCGGEYTIALWVIILLSPFFLYSFINAIIKEIS